MLVVEQVDEMGSHRRVVELLRLALRDVEVRVIVPRLDCRRSATMLNIDVVLTSSAFVLPMIDDSTPLVELTLLQARAVEVLGNWRSILVSRIG